MNIFIFDVKTITFSYTGLIYLQILVYSSIHSWCIVIAEYG